MSSINTSVKEYVEQKDVKATRTALLTIGYLADDSSFKEFEESTEYARVNIEDLFENEDGTLGEIDKSLSGYKKIIKLMMNNFSEAKYNKAIEIGSSIFKSVNEYDDIKTEKGEEEEREEESFFTSKKSKKTWITLLAVVITALIVVAFIMFIVKLIK